MPSSTVRFTPKTTARLTSKIEAITKALTDNRDLFEEEAIRLQEAQKAVLQDRVAETHRPQTRGNYLEEALTSSSNRDVRGDGFVVGGGLEGSRAASYFRNLDQGSNIFKGRVLYGFFGDPGHAGPHPGSKEQSRLFQLKSQGAEPESGGGIRNTKGEFRSTTLKPGETPHSGARGAFVIRIKNGIPKYGYIEGGLQDYLNGGAKERISTALKQKVRRTVK